MFVPVERLLIRLRQPRSRADELVTLHARLRAELAKPADAAEHAIAREVRDRKLAVIAALTDVASCATCAKGESLPRGHYDGGACCAGTTNDLFDERELSALARAGTRVADLTPPPRGEVHAGCAFRGPTSCTLAVAHRPARCVHYVCEGLRGELHRRGELDAIEAALAALNRAMAAYTVAFAERSDREVLAPLVAALEGATGSRRSRGA